MYAIKASVSIKNLTHDDEHVRHNCIANYVGLLKMMCCLLVNSPELDRTGEQILWEKQARKSEITHHLVPQMAQESG